MSKEEKKEWEPSAAGVLVVCLLGAPALLAIWWRPLGHLGTWTKILLTFGAIMLVSLVARLWDWIFPGPVEAAERLRARAEYERSAKESATAKEKAELDRQAKEEEARLQDDLLLGDFICSRGKSPYAPEPLERLWAVVRASHFSCRLDIMGSATAFSQIFPGRAAPEAHLREVHDRARGILGEGLRSLGAEARQHMDAGIKVNIDAHSTPARAERGFLEIRESLTTKCSYRVELHICKIGAEPEFRFLGEAASAESVALAPLCLLPYLAGILSVTRNLAGRDAEVRLLSAACAAREAIKHVKDDCERTFLQEFIKRPTWDLTWWYRRG